MKSSIAHLEEAFGVHIKVINNDKMPTRKADLPKYLQKMDKISKIFHSSLKPLNSVIGNPNRQHNGKVQ